jgi:hypothetical protein
MNHPIYVGSDRTSFRNTNWLGSFLAPSRAALEKAAPTDPIEIQIAVERPTVFYPALERVLPESSPAKITPSASPPNPSTQQAPSPKSD